ncbi:hypothetical protein HY768_02745 [candidate division TA06 bacterium]|uniref:Uncharacterized protein n=1 Tax=candidate division TA06 bacterium TaxID=2250710 RepID=A0A933MHJ9_UNCT6|nr:hypothetical protein [candidate division TA06 bacterium]
MGLILCHHAFKGPFYDTGQVEDKPGVFVLLAGSDGRYRALGVGYSHAVRSGIEREREKPAGDSKNILMWAVFYDHNLPPGQREELVEEFRARCRTGGAGVNLTGETG